MKMEVFHSTKVTHNFIASKKHIGGFFEALSRMCEDQTYTDLHLVAGDGQIIAAHQVCTALTISIRIQFTRQSNITKVCLFVKVGYTFTRCTCRLSIGLLYVERYIENWYEIMYTMYLIKIMNVWLFFWCGSTFLKSILMVTNLLNLQY